MGRYGMTVGWFILVAMFSSPRFQLQVHSWTPPLAAPTRLKSMDPGFDHTLPYWPNQAKQEPSELETDDTACYHHLSCMFALFCRASVWV